GYCSRSESCSFACRDGVGSVFFLEKDLHPGSKMTLHFTRTTSAALLPRRVSDSVPFSSAKLPEILSRFSVDAASARADAIKSTLAECEAPALAGEAKLCATSLESMVDFATASLGTRDLQAVSTAVGREGTPKQAYTVESVKKMSAPGSELVACHGMKYAYAVFHCHTTTAAAYTVSMAGADGTRVKALAACHTDAAAGVEEAFKKLNVKPGSVPLAIAVGARHAASPAEVYWQNVLPNSPMPSAIRDLLLPDGVGSVFFLEKDLHPGSKMTLHFTRTASTATVLLPRRVSDSIPFSSAKLPEILSRFSVDAASARADAIKSTLTECEAPALGGEDWLCVTSLESMVNFTTASLGIRDLRAVSTAVGREGTPKQAYTIENVKKMSTPGSELVACHGMKYAYAVFHCHMTTAAAYTVSMAGADGTRVEALAACHTDAAAGSRRRSRSSTSSPGACQCATSCPRMISCGAATNLAD
ncbi:BURP domain-containing protein 6, partial [Ananas comosus]